MIAGVPGAFCAGNDITDFLKAAAGGTRSACARISPRACWPGKNRWSRRSAAWPSASARPCCCIATTWLLAPDAVLSTPFLKLGLIPEAASTLLAPMRMGYARAFSMLVMGRPLSAAEAKDAGLVNAVVDPAEVDARGACRGARDRGASAPSSRRVTQPDARPSRRGHQANRRRVHAFQGSFAVRRGPRRIRRVLARRK